MSDYYEGQAKLAEFAIEKLRKMIKNEKAHTSDIERSLSPLKTIDWTVHTIRIVGSKELNEILRLLRGTKLPSAKYRNFADTLNSGIKRMERNLPSGWDLWMMVLEKYSAQEILPPNHLRELITALTTNEILTPWELALYTKEGMLNLLNYDPSLEGIELLWQTAKSWADYIDPPRTTPKITSEKEVWELINSIKAKTIDETKLSTQNVSLKQQLQLPENYDRLTPTGKTKAIAALGPSAPGLLEYLDSQAKINVLRGVQGCLRSVASGITSYVKFCSAVQATPFPITKTILRRWSATFRCTPTFGLYLNHVKKAAVLLGQDTSWHDTEMKAIAKGLANAQDKSFAFSNYVFSQDLMGILEWETWHSPLAQVAFLSYLFSLRVPSETLHLRKATKYDKLLKFEPQEQKVLMGIQRMDDTEVLVAKFRFRKNMRGGCILIRPCLCAETHDKARAICPIHTFWPLVAKNCGAHELLFPKLYANSVNQQLKAVMTKLNYDRGHKYSSHAFRRGATEEIKNSGSTFATIITSGGWTAAGYKSYLDLQADEAINISKLLLETTNSDSNDTDPTDLPVEQKLRKKVRRIPLALRKGKKQKPPDSRPIPLTIRREKLPRNPESTDSSISETSETSD